MTFINPLYGILGLLGIIALIIIYILKPKYQDKMVASTYVWKLSLKYQRPKSPFDWLKSSLLLILQILIILIIALLLSGPMLKSKTVSGEKIIVLDGSVSMQVLENGVSRFDKAKTEIMKLVADTAPEHRITLIYLGSDTNYVVRRSNSLDYIRQHLNALQPSELSVAVSEANPLVESVLRENPEAKLYIYSSKNISAASRVELINYKNSNSWNAGILDLKGNLKPNGYYGFQADLINYGKAAKVTLTLEIDGNYAKSVEVNLSDSDEQLITFPDIQVLNYSKAEVFLDIVDDYHFDNRFITYKKQQQRVNIQLYSEGDEYATTFFLQSSLGSISSSIFINTVSDENELETEGYDLYIYENYEPNILPVDGSIWFINPNDFSNLNLSVGSEVSGNFNLEANVSDQQIYNQILGNINVGEILVTKYRRLTQFENFNVLANVGLDPLILTRKINDQRIVVMPFDFAYSNLPILIDFPFFINNLYKYSTVKSLSSLDFEIGSQISLEAKISANTIQVVNENNEITFEQFPATLKLMELGSYQIINNFDNKAPEIEYIYVHTSRVESYLEIDGGDFIIPHVSANEVSEEFNYTNLLPYILIALFAFVLIEWVVQYREQY